MTGISDYLEQEKLKKTIRDMRQASTLTEAQRLRFTKEDEEEEGNQINNIIDYLKEREFKKETDKANFLSKEMITKVK